jgi:TolB-like protein
MPTLRYIGKSLPLILPAMLLVGCIKTPRASVEPGLEFQKRGEYLKAYQYFQDQARQHPRQPELQTYVDTARGLAFRQAAGQAQKALQRGDLEGFLQGMKLANDVQPSERAQSVVQLVVAARLRGTSDAEILQELTQTMREGERQSLQQALQETAEIIGRQMLAGRIGSPMAVLGFTVEGAAVRESAAAYFENALSEALLGNRIAIVERNKMGEVMKEIALAGTGLVESGQMVQAGQLTGALSVAAGNVYLSEAGGRCQIRVIDVETGQVVWQESRDFIPGKHMLWLGR